MSACRFMFSNHVDDAGMITASSARPGLVGMPAPAAAGSAVAYSAGEHTGQADQVFMVEIDSTTAGNEVGQASFRWRRADQATWEATGVATSSSLLDLADGVRIKWTSGPGDDFLVGDSWSILATRAFGVGALIDQDRDTAWEATGCADEHLTFDLGEAKQVRALVLADHNLSDAASVTLMADPAAAWSGPAYSQALTVTSPHTCLFLDQTYRYWRIAISDSANPAGVVSLGGLYLGDYFQPSRTFGTRYQRSLVAGRSITTTDAGKLAGSSRGVAESLGISFSGLTADDAAGFEAMFRAVHSSAGELRPMFFTPFAEDPGDTLYCLPAATLSRAHQHQGRYSINLSLDEVVRSNV